MEKPTCIGLIRASAKTTKKDGGQAGSESQRAEQSAGMQGVWEGA